MTEKADFKRRCNSFLSSLRIFEEKNKSGEQNFISKFNNLKEFYENINDENNRINNKKLKAIIDIEFERYNSHLFAGLFKFMSDEIEKKMSEEASNKTNDE